MMLNAICAKLTLSAHDEAVFFIPYQKYGLEPILSKGPKFAQSFFAGLQLVQ